ncbi:MAG TPA: hypothetical protein VM754_05085 [Actinomycetota bacterium]|nr:hypothetical protein [Actinomycetota bacterium]
MKNRVHDERGAVLIIVALVMSVLLILSAGGVMLFTLYGSHREMQKTADQSALAGAAALPLLRPGQTLSTLPMNTAYRLTEGVGLDVPLKGLSNVPDPRAVACAYGVRNLAADSSNLVNKFAVGPTGLPSSYCSNSPWADGRINPTLNSLSTPLSACLNNLTTRINGAITELQSGLNGLLGLSSFALNLLLAPLGLNASQVTGNVNRTIDMLKSTLRSVEYLEALSPALLTPQMTVTVTDRVVPPLMSMVTSDNGVQMQVTATAERRLKNAIVLPSVSSPLPTGPSMPSVDINVPLNATKPQIMGALSSVNAELNRLASYTPALSGCQNLLAPGTKIYQDIEDVYDPPESAPYSSNDLIAGATAAANRAAADAGTSAANLAGEAFLVVRSGGPSSTTVSSLLGPVVDLLNLTSVVKLLPVPALDVALIAAHNLEDRNISNPDLIPDTLGARGLFTARLVN